MDINHLLIGAFTSTLLLSACGGGSGDGENEVISAPPVVPLFVEEPTLIPGVSVSFAQPLFLVDASSIDPEIVEGEQVFNIFANLADEGDELTIFEEYETYCEVSYLPTTSPSAQSAYTSLSDGTAEVIFALENDLSRLSFTAINSITQAGRPGQEFSYVLPLDDISQDVVGRGRAFYFNASSDNLIRSTILYIECFGFSQTFFENTALINAFLGGIEFGAPEISELIFPTDTNAFPSVTTREGESL